MANGEWAQAAHGFAQALQIQQNLPSAWHNLGTSFLALGQTDRAVQACNQALNLNPALWQSHLILGKAKVQLDDPIGADQNYCEVLKADPSNPHARIARANLLMNTFGQPLQASELVRPLLSLDEFKVDAQLTTLMAGLYDRDTGAEQHNSQILEFSKASLRFDESELMQLGLSPRANEFMWDTKVSSLKQNNAAQKTPSVLPFHPEWRASHNRKRPLVGFMSPLLSASPVYFLTIAGWKHIAQECDIVVFNRGHKKDWATQRFKDLSVEWVDVQELSAVRLAQKIFDAKLDVLYDLGGWMDPIALKALSVKPARQMFKWVGGQSATTGLNSFDGWIGDHWQSPLSLQHLYSEPLINIEQGYSVYTAPEYLPPIPSHKRDVPVIFSNPAKLSRSFLKYLQTVPGVKSFVHKQFKYPLAKARVLEYLDASQVEFITPTGHAQALEILGGYQTMIDTFPYSSGLTAREARAMGVKVQARVGTLFCERHCAHLV